MRLSRSRPRSQGTSHHYRESHSKDPERRYATAGELADDLGRYLDRRPVRARKDSRLYRLSKFLRRNWLPTTAGSRRSSQPRYRRR